MMLITFHFIRNTTNAFNVVYHERIAIVIKTQHNCRENAKHAV